MTAKTWTQIKRERARGTGSIAVGYEKARAGYMLAERVRALRVAGGLSQGELADRMGTTQSAISRLEAGGTYPSIDTLEKVGQALNAKLVVEFRSREQPTDHLVRSAKRAEGVSVLRAAATGQFVRAGRRSAAARQRRSVGKRAAKKSAKRA